MQEISIPVAYCATCENTGPVVVEEVVFLQEQFMAVYCPGCMSVLNFEGDIEVEWYTPEELERAHGWKLSDSVN